MGAKITKPTQMSGFLFSGPYGPKFELFQNVYYLGCISKVKHNITHL